jgi:hypothetical protein
MATPHSDVADGAVIEQIKIAVDTENDWKAAVLSKWNNECAFRFYLAYKASLEEKLTKVYEAILARKTGDFIQSEIQADIQKQLAWLGEHHSDYQQKLKDELKFYKPYIHVGADQACRRYQAANDVYLDLQLALAADTAQEEEQSRSDECAFVVW